MARRLKCKSWKQVYSRYLGKRVWRCAKFRRPRSAKRRAAASSYRRKSGRRKSGYKKGSRPFNKGKKCKLWGYRANGTRYCASFKGGVSLKGRTFKMGAAKGMPFYMRGKARGPSPIITPAPSSEGMPSFRSDENIMHMMSDAQMRAASEAWAPKRRQVQGWQSLIKR